MIPTKYTRTRKNLNFYTCHEAMRAGSRFSAIVSRAERGKSDRTGGQVPHGQPCFAARTNAVSVELGLLD